MLCTSHIHSIQQAGFFLKLISSTNQPVSSLATLVAHQNGHRSTTVQQTALVGCGSTRGPVEKSRRQTPVEEANLKTKPALVDSALCPPASPDGALGDFSWPVSPLNIALFQSNLSGYLGKQYQNCLHGETKQ